MDGGITGRTLARLCKDCAEQMQAVAELLLLNESVEPTSLEAPAASFSSAQGSYSKCRDASVAGTKQLAILAHNVRSCLDKGEMDLVFEATSEMAEVVITLAEVATQAAFVIGVADSSSTPAVPGLLNRYRLLRAKQGIESAGRKFSTDYGSMDEPEVLRILSNIAVNLALVTQTCESALAECRDVLVQRQLQACVTSVQGTTAALLAAVKALAETGRASDRSKCAMFLKPVLASLQSVIDFASLSEFSGRKAKMSRLGRKAQQEVQAHAMKVVSAAIQHLDSVGALAEGNAKASKKYLNACAVALSESSKELSAALRANAPGKHTAPSGN